MDLTKPNLSLLSERIDRKAVSERPGPGGKSLSYVEGWFVIDQANKIFGVGNWSRKVLSLSSEKRGRVWAAKAIVRVSVSINGKECEAEDVGHGDKSSQENAEKEAVTDALKRALRSFGSQFGNSLYMDETIFDGDFLTSVEVAELKQFFVVQCGNSKKARQVFSDARRAMGVEDLDRFPREDLEDFKAYASPQGESRGEQVANLIRARNPSGR